MTVSVPVKKFHSISPLSIINKHGLQSLLGDRSRTPDQNFLRFTYKYATFYCKNKGDTEYKAIKLLLIPKYLS